MSKRLTLFRGVALALGFGFLYLPIALLIAYSFNASRLVAVWGGWSLQWYSEFFHDQAMLDAAWMSLRVGATSATLATLLGTLAAVALSRGAGFRGLHRRDRGVVVSERAVSLHRSHRRASGVRARSSGAAGGNRRRR